MANRPYTQEEITLEDYDSGEEYTFVLRPLPLARLRKFMAAWTNGYTDMDKADKDSRAGGGEGLSVDEVNAKTFDIYVQCVAIAIEPQVKKLGKIEKLYNAQGAVSKEYTEFIENLFDDSSVKQVLKVCGNIDLTDPKLQELAMEMAQQEM